MLAVLRVDPQVVETGGVLYRRPGPDADLGDIAFYEPLDWRLTSPPVDHPLPMRMLLENEHSNASYDYHEISLADWPEPKVYGGRDRRRNYVRIAGVAITRGTVEWGSYQPDHIVDEVIQNGTLADRTTLFNYLLAPDEYQWMEMLCWNGNRAVFLLSLNPECSVAHYVKTWDMHASEAVWHLLDWLHNRGDRRADIWNVSVTNREAYKRAFFTSTSLRRCYYAGENPYPWLHLDGKQS